jgi:hypothetical protein
MTATHEAPTGAHTTHHQRGTGDACTAAAPSGSSSYSHAPSLLNVVRDAQARRATNPAALPNPRAAAPPAHPPQEVTACPAAPTGTDTPTPPPPAVPGWPGLTGLDDDETRGVGIGTLGTLGAVVAFLLIVMWVTF